jgi:hypothetical protein
VEETARAVSRKREKLEKEAKQNGSFVTPFVPSRDLNDAEDDPEVSFLLVQKNKRTISLS